MVSQEPDASGKRSSNAVPVKQSQGRRKTGPLSYKVQSANTRSDTERRPAREKKYAALDASDARYN